MIATNLNTAREANHTQLTVICRAIRKRITWQAKKSFTWSRVFLLHFDLNSCICKGCFFCYVTCFTRLYAVSSPLTCVHKKWWLWKQIGIPCCLAGCNWPCVAIHTGGEVCRREEVHKQMVGEAWGFQTLVPGHPSPCMTVAQEDQPLVLRRLP